MIAIPRKELMSLIAPLAPAVSSLTGKHIMLTCDGSALHAEAVSEGVTIATRTALASEPFTACPNYETLRAALSGLSGANVTLALADGRMTVKAGGKRIVPVIDPSSFPAMVPVDSEPVMVDGAALAAALSFVRGLAGSQRPAVEGVRVEADCAVATNLNFMRVAPLPDALTPFTLPSAAATTLAKLLPSAPVEVRIGKRLSVDFGSGVFASAFSSQPYPDWRRIVPEGGDSFSLHAEEMARACAALAVFADGGDRAMTAVLDGDLKLTTAGGEEVIEDTGWLGEPRRFVLNAAATGEMFAAFGEAEVEIFLGPQPVSPILVVDKAGRKGIMMPLRG